MNSNTDKQHLNISSNIPEDVYIVVSCSDIYPINETSSESIINNIISKLTEDNILRSYKKKQIPLLCNEGGTKQLTIFNSNKFILWHGYIPISNGVTIEKLYSDTGTLDIQIKAGNQILPNIRICGSLNNSNMNPNSNSFIIILIIGISVLILLAIIMFKSKKKE